MSSIMVFDCETNGRPVKWNAPVTLVENWPRVIQLAWQVFNFEGNTLGSFVGLVKPDGWEVPIDKFWIDHGYSTEICEKEGLGMAEILEKMVDDVTKFNVTHLVAHNIQFDMNIVGAEMIRYGISSGRKLTKVCTMKSSTDLCAIPGPYGFKWPKLIELYNHLFGEGFEGAHDALADVNACAKCFFKLKQLGIYDSTGIFKK